MQYPADIFRWQVVTWSWKQLVETFQVMVPLKNFFSKKGNYIWHPPARNKPAAFKNFFWQSLSRWKQEYNFLFFLSFPIEFHVENGEGAEEKGFQWRQKGSGARSDTKEFFYFVSPLLSTLKKPSKLLEKFEKMGKKFDFVKNNFWFSSLKSRFLHQNSATIFFRVSKNPKYFFRGSKNPKDNFLGCPKIPNIFQCLKILKWF